MIERSAACCEFALQTRGKTSFGAGGLLLRTVNDRTGAACIEFPAGKLAGKWGRGHCLLAAALFSGSV